MDSTASALDTLVAEQVMALVPCDAWEPTNLGSAGGPALLKRCSAQHHCYPRHHPSGVAHRRPSGGPRLEDHDPTCPRSRPLLCRADGQAYGGPCRHRDGGSSYRTTGALPSGVACLRLSGNDTLSGSSEGSATAATTRVGHRQRAVAAPQVSTTSHYGLDGLGAVPATHRRRLCPWNKAPVSDVLPTLMDCFPTHTAQWW